MAAQRHLADVSPEFDHGHVAPSKRAAPFLANVTVEPRLSPARLLQDELRRAFSSGPIVVERFSARRALKFIAPTWLGLWAFIGLVGHIGHH